MEIVRRPTRTVTVVMEMVTVEQPGLAIFRDRNRVALEFV